MFIQDLHAMCSHNQNSIVAWGLPRGGRWLEDIVREHSVYLDVAIIIAGYPETKGGSQHFAVARELIAVKSTLVCMVHFAADEFCNASYYPRWYAEFEIAMQCPRPDRCTGPMSFMVPGNHTDAGSLWRDWDFKFCPQMVEWFEIMWCQLDRKRCQ